MCLVQECIKFVVLAFNCIFVLVGAALIAVGTLYQVNFTDITKAIPEAYGHLNLIPILTIVVGSIIFIISFLGCCGAIKNSPCLLTTYAVILLVIFVLQIALGVFAFLEIKNESDLEKNVNTTIDKIFHKTDKPSEELIDLIQEQLKCCGTTGPASWPDKTPKSCYAEDNPTKIYTKGCQKAFFEFLVGAARIIGIVVLALAATEVIGATFALCMGNSVRNERRRLHY